MNNQILASFTLLLLFAVQSKALDATDEKWTRLRMVSLRSAAAKLNMEAQMSCLDGKLLDEKSLNDMAKTIGGDEVSVKIISRDTKKCTLQCEISGAWKNENKVMSKMITITLPLTSEDKKRLDSK